MGLAKGTVEDLPSSSCWMGREVIQGKRARICSLWVRVKGLSSDSTLVYSYQGQEPLY